MIPNPYTEFVRWIRQYLEATYNGYKDLKEVHFYTGAGKIFVKYSAETYTAEFTIEIEDVIKWDAKKRKEGVHADIAAQAGWTDKAYL